MAFDQATADKVCERIALGEPLRQICRESGFPSYGAIYDWLEVQPEFASRFAHARARGFDAIADEALEIADDATNDYMLRRRAGDEDGEGGKVLDAEHVQRSKLRIETRLKLLAKWDPKRYGERTTLAGDPENPLIPAIDVSKATPEQLRALAGFKLGGE